MLPYNSEVFIEFSTKEAGSYSPLQQLAFVSRQATTLGSIKLQNILDVF